MSRKRPREGEIYTHFKGKRYKVLHMAVHTETAEELVVYEALYGGHGIYARHLDMFLSPVDHEKYPDAPQEYRFELTGFVKPGETLSEEEPVQEEVPLIIRFLDLESNEEKLKFLQRHRTELNQHFLSTAAESLGYTETGKTPEMQYEGVINCLRMKIKYETGRLR